MRDKEINYHGGKDDNIESHKPTMSHLITSTPRPFFSTTSLGVIGIKPYMGP